MYRQYLVKRILYGIVMYVILIFVFSLLFNATSEQTARSQIEEEVRLVGASLVNPTTEQVTRITEERRTELYRMYHLDRSLLERVFYRTWDTLTLRFGNSTIIKSSRGDREVGKIILEVIPRSLILLTTAVFCQLLIGLFLGLKKAQRAGGLLDRTTSVATMVVYGMPSWWLGMIMIMFLVYGIPLFPSGGLHSSPPPSGFLYTLDLFYHMALPLLTLLLIGSWGLSLLTRNIVLGVLQEDYIMAARARGLPERNVLFGHTLRTSAPPITTIAILSLLGSVSGNILFEGIFSWPGMGNLYWVAVEQNDVPVLMGLLSITTGLYICGLVLLDLIYGFLDPRIKVGGKA